MTCNENTLESNSLMVCPWCHGECLSWREPCWLCADAILIPSAMVVEHALAYDDRLTVPGSHSADLLKTWFNDMRVKYDVPDPYAPRRRSEQQLVECPNCKVLSHYSRYGERRCHVCKNAREVCKRVALAYARTFANHDG